MSIKGRLQATWTAFKNYQDLEKIQKRREREANNAFDRIIAKFGLLNRPIVDALLNHEAEYPEPSVVRGLMDDFNSYSLSFEEQLVFVRAVAQAHYQFPMHPSVSRWMHANRAKLNLN